MVQQSTGTPFPASTLGRLEAEYAPTRKIRRKLLIYLIFIVLSFSFFFLFICYVNFIHFHAANPGNSILVGLILVIGMYFIGLQGKPMYIWRGLKVQIYQQGLVQTRGRIQTFI